MKSYEIDAAQPVASPSGTCSATRIAIAARQWAMTLARRLE
jgi:hypothetical protein